MIIDNHTHVMPAIGELSEYDFSSVAERNRILQKLVYLLCRSYNWATARKVEDNVIDKEAWKGLWDEKQWGNWEGIRDVNFRVKGRKCFWKTKDGAEYYMDISPYPGTPENLISLMDEAGVDKAVFHTGEFLNKYAGRIMRKYPGRFLCLCHVDEGKAYQKEEIEKLHMYVEELGLKGIFFDAHDPAWEGYGDFHEDKYDPFWKEVEALGIPSYHCGSYNGRHNYEKALPILKRLLEKFPSLKIILLHGYPPRFFLKEGINDFVRKMALDIVKNYDVYLEVLPNVSDIFQHPKKTKILRYLYETFGPHKLLWGSELTGKTTAAFYADQLRYLEKNCDYISKNDRNLILGGNVQRIYDIYT